MIGYEELISDCRPIYADFLQLCCPVRPPEPWGRFKTKADCWRPPTDEKAALTALQEKHRDRDLISSGVVIENQAGSLELSPMFLETPTAIVPLRSSPQSKPFDFLTAQGTITGRLPIHASCQDHLVIKEIGERGFVLGAFCMQDVMSLRAIEMPAALAVGMEEFTQRSMQEFRNAFHLSGPSPSLQSPHLILVGWALSRLARIRPEALDRVIRNIFNTASCHGMALDTVSVWQPDTAEIRSLAKCLEVGGRKAVIDAILSSLDQSAKPLAPSESQQKVADGVQATGARLRKALLRSDGTPAQRRKQWREYLRAVDDALVTPLLELAEMESDLDERSRLAGLAQINRLLHSNAMCYLAKLEKEIATHGLRGDGNAYEAQGVTKLLDVLYRFTKGS